jgi:glycosyltransferase involved in cell wall biosynthesis
VTGTPDIGIVLIFLDAEAFIAEAIESVLAQSYTRWELILVDDGSSDASTVIAKDYAARFAPKIRYVEHDGHRNLGMSASRNRGARETKTRFLAFIDADDVWLPGKLEAQRQILDRHSDAALVLGALLYWQSWCGGRDAVLLTAGASNRLLPPPIAFLAADPVGVFPGAGVDFLARREAFDAVGGFEENFRGLYEDQAFFAKLFLAESVYISGETWLKYRQHPKSCVSTAEGDGSYSLARKAYFDWLTAYVVAHRPDPAVLRKVARARAPTLLRRIGLKLAKRAARRRPQ